MKLKTKVSEYQASNSTLYVSPDLTKATAISYDWWHFVETDKVGNIILNYSHYSSSTSNHQSSVSFKLKDLGIIPALVLRDTQANLKDGIQEAITDEIKSLKKQRSDLLKATKVKGSHRRKNLERKETRKELKFRIKDLLNIRNNYIDKAPIPQKREKLNLENHIKPDWVDESDKGLKRRFDLRKVQCFNALKKHFKKPNGKINLQGLLEYLRNYSMPWNKEEIPSLETIKELRNLLKIKGNENTNFILSYSHSKDIPAMVGTIDSPERDQVIRWLRSMNDHPKNVLLLEKLHTYLVNRLNRKNYAPKEPTELPVSKTLLKLEGTKDLTLIKTDRELKAEGRRQSHCIGSSGYLHGCMKGNQVLNYKGHTFYLTQGLDLIEVHGRHNQHTPEKIRKELFDLIKAA